MTNNKVVIELGTVKITRGKYEYHTKPCATAFGVTEASYSSPILRLLNRLLEEGSIDNNTVVDVMRGTMRIFNPLTVSEWLEGRAIGRKPGSRPWLRKNDDEEDDDE